MNRTRKIDPRGIMRTISSATWTKDGNVVVFDCGHSTNMAGHFAFKVGAECRCFTCGEEARKSAANDALAERMYDKNPAMFN